MMKMRSYFIVVFTIFSILVLLQALLYQVGFVDEFDSLFVIQYFVMSSLLAATVMGINRLLGKRPILIRMAVTIAAALAQVIVLGGIFMHWFTLRAKWVLLSFGLSVVITAILYFITGMFETKHTADQINQAIREKRKKP